MKSKLFLSGLTSVGLLGLGVAGATTLNSAAHDGVFAVLDVKAEDNSITPQDSSVLIQTSVIEDSSTSQSVTKPVAIVSTETKSIDVNQGIETEAASVLDNVHAELKSLSEQTMESIPDASVSEIVDDLNQHDVEADVSESKQDTTIVSDTIGPKAESTVVSTVNINPTPVVNQVSNQTVVAEPISVSTSTTNDDTHMGSTSVTPVAEKVEADSMIPVESTEPSTASVEIVVTEPVVEPTVETIVEPEPVKTNPIHDTTNTYPVGQCTWGVKSLASWVGNYWGNANQWGASAQAAGYSIGTTPRVGAVIVFPNSTYEGVNYGHVGYVTAVYSNDSIEIMEANYAGNQSVGNYRGTFNPNASWWGGGVYYIYPNA